MHHKKVREFFAGLPKEYMQFVEVTEEAYELAQKYVDEKLLVIQVPMIADTLQLPQLTRLTFW